MNPFDLITFLAAVLAGALIGASLVLVFLAHKDSEEDRRRERSDIERAAIEFGDRIDKIRGFQ